MLFASPGACCRPRRKQRTAHPMWRGAGDNPVLPFFFLLANLSVLLANLSWSGGALAGTPIQVTPTVTSSVETEAHAADISVRISGCAHCVGGSGAVLGLDGYLERRVGGGDRTVTTGPWQYSRRRVGRRTPIKWSVADFATRCLCFPTRRTWLEPSDQQGAVHYWSFTTGAMS